MSTSDQIIALAEQAESLLNQIETLAQQTPPPPPTDTEQLVVNSAAGLSVRAAASVTSAKLGGLTNGASVSVGTSVTVDGVYTWVRLYAVNNVQWTGVAYVCKQEGSTVYLRPQ